MSLLPCRTKLFLVVCLCVAATPFCLAQGSGDNIMAENVTIGFSEVQYSVFEGQVVGVCVNAMMILVNQTVNVTVSTRNDTASPGVDYMDSSFILSFTGPGEQCVNITTLVNNDTNDDLQFTVLLMSASSAQLFPNTTTVTVRNVIPTVIELQPLSLTVNQNEDAMFTVEANGTALTYQWQRNGVDLSSAVNASLMGEATETLMITAAQDADEGAYRCVITNVLGQSVISEAAFLNVVVMPTITVQPMSVLNALPGQMVNFTVVADGDTPTYQWYFQAMLLENATEATLTIENVMDEDEGMYFCSVSNGAGSVETDMVLLMLVPEPTINPRPRNGIVLVDNDISFSCTAEGNITWLVENNSNGESVTFTGPVVENTTSTITVSVAMIGGYSVTCTATNARGMDNATATFDAIEIQVDDVMAGVSSNAVFFCNVTGLTEERMISYIWTSVRNGIAQSNAFPSEFFRDRISRNNERLTLIDVGPNDGDFDYACVIGDGSRDNAIVGNDTAILTVFGPIITESPLNSTLNAGETLELNCTAMNNMDATRNLTFAWEFRPVDTTAISILFRVDSPRVNVTDLGNATFRSDFRIDAAQSSDGGEYTCHVTNRRFADSVNAAATVVVFFTPMLTFEPMPVIQINRNLTLRCDVTAQPNATFAEIARLGPGGARMIVANVSNVDQERTFSVEYTFTTDSMDDDGAMFQCLAENANGQATADARVTVQARPGPIDHINDVSTQLVSLDSVNVTWPPPPNNNANITSYIIYVCQFLFAGNCSEFLDIDVAANDTTRLTNLPSGQVQFRISPLTPQQTYQVRIRARNDVGIQSNPAEGRNFSSANPLDGAVVNASNITTSSVVILTWELPSLAIATDGLNVSFIVSYFDDGNPTNISSSVVEYVDSEAPGFTISTLEFGRRHTVNIVANYSNPGLIAAQSTLMKIELAAENTPLRDGMVDEIIGENTLTVRWPDPENTNFLNRFVVTYTNVSLSNASGRRKRQTQMTVEVDNPTVRSAELPFAPFSRFTVDVDVVYQPPPDNTDVTVLLIPTTIFETPERPPGAPVLISADNEDVLKIRVTWIPPSVLNGIIVGYRVQFAVGQELMILTANADARSLTSVDLMPNTQYTIGVLAETGGGTGDVSNEIMTTTSFGVSEPIISTIVIGTPDNRQFSITYNGANNELGRVSRIQVVVIRGGGIDNTRNIESDTLLPQGTSPTNYYVVFSGDVPPQRTTYVIGNGISTVDRTVTYPNPPPDLDVDYQVFIRVFSAFDDMVYTDSTVTRVLRINAPLDPAVIIGPIAAIAVVLLLVLVILLLFVFIFTRPRRGYTIASTREDGRGGKRGIEMRRTRLFSPVVNVPIPDVFTSAGQPTTLVCEASGTPAPEVVWTQNEEMLDKERFIQLADSSLFINDTDLKDEGAYIVTATNSAGTAEQMVRVTVIRPSAPEPDPDHPPIKVGEFTEKIALLRAEDDEGLEDEYSELEPDITFTSYAAKININKNKNRYINIIPYDHSRVVLTLQDNTPGSDYINASYVDGFNRPNAYIATQGPQPSTFPDFWRMVWEFDCPTIVMVTNLKEEDKLKCHQYWPSYGTITYGSIQVTLKGVENLAEYSIRTFHITPIAGQSRVQMPVREVKQFHFLVWPDHGVPQFATPLLSFRKRVAKYHPDKKGPMVVHCSAGVGRTGTFITIDTMLRKMEQEGIIDIFNFVRHMRFRRNYMVQTGPQYVFIHDAMLEAIMCGDNSMPAPEVKKRFQELMEVDPESKKTRLQLQYENLNSNSPQDDDFDCTIATLPDNMAKNRFKVHLPANDYRVPLGAPPTRSEVDEDADEDEEEKEKEEPDYICASFADGYRQRDAFIITQAPMSSTTGDFWKMIWEQKSAAIVMLTELEEDGKEMSVKYWPSEVGEAGLFGSFQLELSEDEKDKGDYVTRKFKLSHVDTPQDCRIVTQFHFTKWPRTSVPSNPQSVIDLIDEIQRVQRKSGNQPITIHCDDGVSRTGAFCTLYSVLERVKVDQVVDIYLATKTLRIQRAGVLDTFDQYVFVHKAVLEFLESFSDYQNFK